MPLSEHEQRLLDEMERNLYGSSSDVHSAKPSGRPNYRFVALGTITAVLGLVILVVAVMTQLILVGVAGFVVMFGGVLWASRVDRRSPSETGAQSTRPSRPSRPGFMERMEQRWDGENDQRL